jgi:glycine reductase
MDQTGTCHMRLEMGLVHIRDVRFGSHTAIEDNALVIDRGEITRLLEQEPVFDRVEVELTHPGESCRIIHVLDVLEPRYRLGAIFLAHSTGRSWGWTHTR